MAMIHVNRGGTSLGIFSEDDVRAGLQTGRFVSTDLGWREGMTQWQPLSLFTEFAAATPAPGAPAPESAIPPPAGPPPGAAVAPTPSPGVQLLQPRGGLPWEHRETRGLFNAFADTLAMILSKPSTAFSVMRTEGGFGGPLLFAVIGGGIGAIVAFILMLGASSFGMLSTRHDAMGAMLGMTVSWAGFIGRLVMVAIAPFIWAALVHLSLMLLGGAKKSYETTFRVAAFAQGATAPLQLVPCCGGLVSVIWNIAANCIGIARAHEIDSGKATLAVILPLIVCCGAGLFIMIAFFGGIAAFSSHDWGQ